MIQPNEAISNTLMRLDLQHIKYVRRQPVQYHENLEQEKDLLIVFYLTKMKAAIFPSGTIYD